MKVGILTLPGSNIYSVKYWLKRNGVKSILLTNSIDIKKVDCLILPGVGSFDTAMEFIINNKNKTAIIDYVNSNKTLIGICCGMQILFNSSEEGKLPGLSLLNGHVRKISSGKERVPNIGWRKVSYYVDGHAKNFSYYFMHSFGISREEFEVNPTCNEFTTITCNTELIASFKYNNIYGFQYHPEKSYSNGDILLKNILDEIKSHS